MALALPWGAPLTADDLASMPDDGHRYELVEGTLLVTPAPNLAHQRCIGALYLLLHAARGPEHTVLVAPFEFRPSPATVLQPDLLVGLTGDFGPARIERAPLLVVEVQSPSTRLVDLGSKRLAYQVAGVPAYWLIDPEAPSLTVLHLDGGRYVEHASVSGRQPYRASRPFDVTVVPADLLLD